MKLCLILLVLLWKNVGFSLTQTECSKLPTSEHAFVSEEFKKAEYQEGDVIYFSCEPGYSTHLNTSYICTDMGWRAVTIGQCFEHTGPVALSCRQPPLLENGYSQQYSLQYESGQRVRYWCNDSYTMKGGPYRTGTNGQWTGDIQCIWSQGCGQPPRLENGDTLTSSNVAFAHNARVQYQCQILYIMEGGPYKTCFNGEWTGEIKCLKPCTVDSTVMDPHNIKFRYGYKTKLYTAHNTGSTFACKPGMTHDGRREMRQICQDGVMLLPTCY